MDNDDDFTFCQVASPNSEDDFKGKNLASDINGIKIDDGAMNNSSVGFTWKDQTQENPTPTKQATVGSLSFKVTDMSVKQLPKENAVENAATSVKNGKELKKAPSRAKVPFEKGYSQMDWLKLTRTHPDLAGLKGQSNRRLIGMSEVKQHRTEGSMWTVLKGRVYNLSPYMKFHPGGDDILMKAVGKDCTSLFNKYHAWVNADFLLEKCLVGILDQENQ